MRRVKELSLVVVEALGLGGLGIGVRGTGLGFSEVRLRHYNNLIEKLLYLKRMLKDPSHVTKDGICKLVAVRSGRLKGIPRELKEKGAKHAGCKSWNAPSQGAKIAGCFSVSLIDDGMLRMSASSFARCQKKELAHTLGFPAVEAQSCVQD